MSAAGRSRVRGFTLVEVLLAITVLAAGALLALPALQRAGGHLMFLYQRHDADAALNNLLTSSEMRFRSEGHLRNLPLEGELVEGGTRFTFLMTYRPVNRGEALMEVTATVRWPGQTAAGLSRSAYVTN